MLYKLLVLLHPFVQGPGRPLAFLLLLGSIGLVVYGCYYESSPRIWWSAAGAFASCLALTLLCTFHGWWLFKLRPRGRIFMPFE
ncbi:hypothetical protein thsps21_33160 [Pseudomonas sp. No.21]|uniref:hypothetical protein n=1 Tax=Pseudomonas tohonis TaxID=2725477 RepID=UPI001F3A48F1|nr:hypothetical protein [Pseudomonas tohonis]GJN48149.1 hypothetical protein TUM20249_41350 [Pseudomonas tohonis]